MNILKTRKFVVLLIIVVLTTSILLAGCGGFNIKGTWNVTEGSYGQAQMGAVIVFDGKNCNLYSPKDTYSFTKSGKDYKLNGSGLLGGNYEFIVKKIDNNHIELYEEDVFCVAMKRG